jgi:hypothetical protein
LTGGIGDPITTKPGCTFTRPDGAGVSVLQADQKSTVDGTTDCVDFASVERGPGSGTTGLTFLPFAQEDLRYATSNPTASFPTVPATNAPQTLTTANLTTIYSCGASGTTSRWSDFGGTSTDAVQALIPQPGSGIRRFFENSIGVSDATIQAGVNSGCILQVQDDDPAPIRANADRIGLFDVPLFTTKYSDSGIQLDTTGFSATHLDYNVLRVDANGQIANPNLVPIFGDGTATDTGWICSSAAQAIVQQDGFSPVTLSGHTCGVA